MRCARRQVSDIGGKSARHSRNGPSRASSSKIGCQGYGWAGWGWLLYFVSRLYLARRKTPVVHQKIVHLQYQSVGTKFVWPAGLRFLNDRVVPTLSRLACSAFVAHVETFQLVSGRQCSKTTSCNVLPFKEGLFASKTRRYLVLINHSARAAVERLRKLALPHSTLCCIAQCGILRRRLPRLHLFLIRRTSPDDLDGPAPDQKPAACPAPR